MPAKAKAKKQKAHTAEELNADFQRLKQVGNFSGALERLAQLQVLRPDLDAAPLRRQLELDKVAYQIDRGRYAEAQAWLDARPQDPEIETLRLRLLVRQGHWEQIFSQLLDPGRVQAAEAILRTELTDLRILAQSSSLPGEHPLRLAASQLNAAFEQVTSGPAPDCSLPLLSRRSPLSDWLLLVQAIRSFHDGQDEQCRKYLLAMDDKSIAARGRTRLLAALQGKTSFLSAVDHDQDLRSDLKRLDRMFANEPTSRQIKSIIQKLLDQLGRRCPELVHPFLQRLAVRCYNNGDSCVEVLAQLPFYPTDEPFWEDWARVTQQDGNPVALVGWEEYRQHSNLSPLAEASLLAHMARLAGPVDLNSLRGFQPTLLALYRRQPQNIRERSALVRNGKVDPHYLSIERMYHRACALDPHPGHFEAWLDWEARREGKPEAAGQAWLQRYPDDSRPLLRLAEYFEHKQASAKALQYLERAILADPINPRLQEARVRLAVANLVRTARAGKPHLMAPHFAVLETSCDVAVSLVRDALRCLENRLKGQAQAAEVALQRVAAGLGSSAAARLLVANLDKPSKANRSIPPDGNSLKALIGLVKLKEQLRLDLRLPESWEKQMIQQLKDGGNLLELCEACHELDLLELPFAVTRLGLQCDGPDLAEFLYWRAQLLLFVGTEDEVECLAAARELAREHKLPELLGKIRRLTSQEHIPESELKVNRAQLQRIVQRERQRQELPEYLDEFDYDPRDLLGDLPDELLELVASAMLPPGKKGSR